MEEVIQFLASLAPTSLMPVAALLLALGGGAVAWPLVVAKGDRNDLKRRLKVDDSEGSRTGRGGAEEEAKASCARRR